MSKKTCFSNVKHPENHSKKACVCGGHQGKRGKKKIKIARQSLKTTYHLPYDAEDFERDLARGLVKL